MSKPVLSKEEVNALSQKGPSGVDPRFIKTAGIDVYTGNELLVKGALEAGAALITGYPGSPVSDVFEVLSSISPYLADRGIVAQIANNEALAASRLNGASQAGLRAMAVMKSVGLHVAADALAVGNLMEVRQRNAGALIVVGDDPWNETTQINSDSRFLSRHLHMPVIEPSTFQELKDWINVGFDLSGYSDLYITYLLTTNMADGGGTVELKSHPQMDISQKRKKLMTDDGIKISDSVLIPPHTSMREATLKQRHARLLERVKEINLNEWHGPRKERIPVGFVTSGLSYGYLKEVLQLLGLWDELPVLKLGMTYPLDVDLIENMASRVSHLVVVEEKRGFLEGQISELLLSLNQKGKLSRVPALWGKAFPDNEKGFPSDRGLNVSVILNVLGPAFLRWKDHFPTLNVQRVEKELAEIVNTKSASYDVPVRTPTFCPGCPHRDSAVASQAVKIRFANDNEKDVIFHGESGCHSMLQFAPNEGLMQNYSGMGVGGGTGAGMSPFIENPQVVFLGDGTFFHSGIIAVSDSIKHNQDITYIILENKTTAMTGHQPNAGNDVDIMGKPTVMQDIEKTVRSMGGGSLFVRRANPADRDAYEKLLGETVPKPGVKIIIADKECAITLNRRLNQQKKATIKSQGYIPFEEKINITPDVCEYCLECTKATACPGLTVEETDLGRKITTDLSTCVDDGACSRTKACPSFEKVTIKRSRPIIKKEETVFDFSVLPTPKLFPFDRRWASYSAGVGGMGAGIVSAVMVRAGMKEGYDVSFLDKKGLAIRNGGVYGHVVFSKFGPIECPVIPYGKADLLIGLDILEAARALDGRMNLRVAHPGRTHAIVNNHKTETVLSLMGREDFDPDKLEEVIKAKVCLGGYLFCDFAEISERHMGSKLYANMMLLGAAYQKGWLPLSENSILDAIKSTVRKSDVETNHRAFKLGRFLIHHPEMLYEKKNRKSFSELVNDNVSYLLKDSLWGSGKRAKAYKSLMDRVDHWLMIPKKARRMLVRTIYDLVRYGGVGMAQRYIALVWSVYQKDQRKFGFKATQAVVEQLYRVMAIKDEVWVAQLLTSPEKYERDQQRYQIDPSRGDKVSYLHFNRPQFVVWGKKIEFDLNTKDWMLKIMRRAGFLRTLLPEWHKKEKDFRDWYIEKVKSFTFFEKREDYNLYLKVLESAAEVRGYREIRYTGMDRAQKKGAMWLSQLEARRHVKENQDHHSKSKDGRRPRHPQHS